MFCWPCILIWLWVNDQLDTQLRYTRWRKKNAYFLKWVLVGRVKVGDLMVKMEEMWFQQDGATAHTARASMTVVWQMFLQHVVSRFGDVPWPPCSPDLSACDFFLWGHLKSKVYIWKPRTVDDLKVSIRKEIATVPQAMLINVMQYFEESLRTCVRQEGRHLSYIISRNWLINVNNQNWIYYRLFWC